jgi:CRP/FNR family cyclic AMP-dependent transcriptional regulator
MQKREILCYPQLDRQNILDADAAPPMVQKPNIAAVPRSVAGVLLFHGLDAAARQALERRCTWQRWNPGEHIIDREQPDNDVYFIVAGKARVVEYNPAGNREVVLDEIAAGGVFGELSAIDGEPRSATIVAAEETLTASLGAKSFVELLFDHREAGIALLCRLTEIVRQSTSRIVELSTRDAQVRVLNELLRMAKSGGGLPPNTALIQPAPVNSELASKLGATRETVSRAMSDLAHRGLVERRPDGLHLLDVKKLSGMAETGR